MSFNELFCADSFNNADEYITYQLTDNKGEQNCISKDTLIMLAKEYGIEVFSSTSKTELVEAVYKVMGKDILEYCKHTGITAYAFMCKYRLLPDEIREFTNAGLLEITGTLKVKDKDGEQTVNLYSAYQYFGLDDNTISEWREIINGKKTQVSQNS